MSGYLVCCCSLAGTRACLNCARWKEFNPVDTNITWPTIMPASQPVNNP